ncbi:CPBP family intramembrane metalloprotease [Enterobacteriaceae bacterium H11S18]|uniref:CPBP family intramembrane glutamic endopeptidase n=1 Tax=Dryocola clanedunensis TaxID=2925396 RepID=UPI0022F0E872|nr:CPBP family intramembrane glutamic endopeptidase [Dryocola clanedunensis]MCT4709241.1 CPBP family intramembrane metalloprotease [Dryocola clanedunensis]
MKSLQLTFLIEFILGVVVFVCFFAKAESMSFVKIKTAFVALCILLLIQFAAYSIRAHEAGFMTITRDNILTILMMVLIVPFFEEVFYRGCLLGFLKPLGSDIVFPIMATSVLFSLMHMQYNSLTDHFILFFISVILCLVRIMTKSLLLPYTLHMLMNLFAFAICIQSFY